MFGFHSADLERHCKEVRLPRDGKLARGAHVGGDKGSLKSFNGHKQRDGLCGDLRIRHSECQRQGTSACPSEKGVVRMLRCLSSPEDADDLGRLPLGAVGIAVAGGVLDRSTQRGHGHSFGCWRRC